MGAYRGGCPIGDGVRPGFRPGPNSNFARLQRGAPFAHVQDFAEAAAQMPDDAIARAAVEVADLAPVFDAILVKAMDLCGAAFGEMHIFDGEHYRAAALRGVPPAYAELRKRGATDASSGTISARVVEGERIIHVVDLKAEEPYRIGDPQRRLLVDIGGARTALAVALRRDDTLLGLLMIYRQEVQPFSEKHITLLENFAAQAVIAMAGSAPKRTPRAAGAVVWFGKHRYEPGKP